MTDAETGDYPVRVEAVDEPRYLAWRWGDRPGAQRSSMVMS